MSCTERVLDKGLPGEESVRRKGDPAPDAVPHSSGDSPPLSEPAPAIFIDECLNIKFRALALGVPLVIPIVYMFFTWPSSRVAWDFLRALWCLPDILRQKYVHTKNPNKQNWSA